MIRVWDDQFLSRHDTHLRLQFQCLALQIKLQGLMPVSQTTKNMQLVNAFWNDLRDPPLDTQELW